MGNLAVVDELRHLTRVRVSATGVGACVARIEDIRRPEDMPDFEGLEGQRDRLREQGVTRVAVISYEMPNDSLFVFTALEIAGGWFDTKGQKLTLEVIGQYEWPQLPRN